LEDQVFTGGGYWQEFKHSYAVIGFVDLLFALITGTTAWVAIWIIGKGIYRVKVLHMEQKGDFGTSIHVRDLPEAQRHLIVKSKELSDVVVWCCSLICYQQCTV